MVKPIKGSLSFASIAALGVLAACGTSSTTTSSSAGATGIAGCKGTITVATDLPLTGGDVTDGPYVQMAAELAVTQAQQAKLLGGCTLKYISKDNSTVLANGHDPAQGEANITALASDATVMGVVGPFNSSVALAEIPVASDGPPGADQPLEHQPVPDGRGRSLQRPVDQDQHLLAVPGAPHLLPGHRQRRAAG